MSLADTSASNCSCFQISILTRPYESNLLANNSTMWGALSVFQAKNKARGSNYLFLGIQAAAKDTQISQGGLLTSSLNWGWTLNGTISINTGVKYISSHNNSLTHTCTFLNQIVPGFNMPTTLHMLTWIVNKFTSVFSTVNIFRHYLTSHNDASRHRERETSFSVACMFCPSM